MAYLADSMRERWLDPDDDDDNRCQCVTCGEWFEKTEMLSGEYESGVWCSFRCWYLDGNIGSMKRELLTALQSGKAENWLDANAENFTPSTYDRWERVIKRINEKTAQSAETLKAA